jgi:hypothetical protein
MAAVVLAWSASARAGDIVKLGLDKSSTPTVTLELKPGDDAETTLAHWHAHYWGGAHFYGGHYGFAHYNVGFYHPWHYGHVNSFYYGGFYPRYYASSFYFRTPVYYSSAPLYYSAPYYCPISLSTNVQLPADQWPAGPGNVLPPMTPTNPGLGTYPYDGGPANPVPMPRADPAAPTTVPPRAIVPGDERPVSLPAKSGKYTYLAYGEKPGQAEKEEAPTFVVRMEPLNKKAPR